MGAVQIRIIVPTEGKAGRKTSELMLGQDTVQKNERQDLITITQEEIEMTPNNRTTPVQEGCKMKTSELIGPALNWAVVTVSGQNAEYWLEKYASEDRRCMCESPSTDWSQGGPIIERERISVVDVDGYDFWKADKLNKEAIPVISYGPTPLIAAMRCYVASKLGDEVEIPEELI